MQANFASASLTGHGNYVSKEMAYLNYGACISEVREHIHERNEVMFCFQVNFQGNLVLSSFSNLECPK